MSVASTADAETIKGYVAAENRQRLECLDIFEEIESTNSFLLAAAFPSPGRFRAALADHQTAGRGRLDRTWVSPPGSGVCLSLAYTFDRPPDRIAALTLAIGADLITGLASVGVTGVMLKWPNDLVAKGRKLAGILTELRTGNDRNTTIVVGVGLNVDLAIGAACDGSVPDTAVGLRELSGNEFQRDQLVALLLDCMIACIRRFEAQGFDHWYCHWRQNDWLLGREIRVVSPAGTIKGTAGGIDDDGALLISNAEGTQRVVAGSIVMDDDGDAAL